MFRAVRPWRARTCVLDPEDLRTDSLLLRHPTVKESEFSWVFQPWETVLRIVRLHTDEDGEPYPYSQLKEGDPIGQWVFLHPPLVLSDWRAPDDEYGDPRSTNTDNRYPHHPDRARRDEHLVYWTLLSRMNMAACLMHAATPYTPYYYRLQSLVKAHVPLASAYRLFHAAHGRFPTDAEAEAHRDVFPDLYIREPVDPEMVRHVRRRWETLTAPYPWEVVVRELRALGSWRAAYEPVLCEEFETTLAHVTKMSPEARRAELGRCRWYTPVHNWPAFRFDAESMTVLLALLMRVNTAYRLLDEVLAESPLVEISSSVVTAPGVPRTNMFHTVTDVELTARQRRDFILRESGGPAATLAEAEQQRAEGRPLPAQIQPIPEDLSYAAGAQLQARYIALGYRANGALRETPRPRIRGQQRRARTVNLNAIQAVEELLVWNGRHTPVPPTKDARGKLARYRAFVDPKLRQLFYHLKLFAYTHLPLMAHMLRAGSYTDAELCATRGDPLRLEPYRLYYPYPGRALHEGALQDHVVSLHHCDFFCNTAPSSAPPETLSRKPLLVRLNERLFRCMADPRDVRHVDFGKFCRDPALFRFMVSCLQCTFLGAYQTSNAVVPFAFALHYASCFDPRRARPETMGAWMNQYRKITELALQQNLVQQLRLAPALYRHVAKRYRTFETCQTEMAILLDDMVTLVSHPARLDPHSVEQYTDRLHAAARILGCAPSTWLLANQYLQIHLQETTQVEALARDYYEFVEAVCASFTLKRKSGGGKRRRKAPAPRKPPPEPPHPEGVSPAFPGECAQHYLDEQCLLRLGQYVETFAPETRYDPLILHKFGMAAEHCQMLRHLEERYCVYSATREALKTCLLSFGPRDYYLTYAFFDLIRQMQSCRIVQVPVRAFVDEQREALARSLGKPVEQLAPINGGICLNKRTREMHIAVCVKAMGAACAVYNPLTDTYTSAESEGKIRQAHRRSLNTGLVFMPGLGLYLSLVNYTGPRKSMFSSQPRVGYDANRQRLKRKRCEEEIERAAKLRERRVCLNLERHEVVYRAPETKRAAPAAARRTLKLTSLVYMPCCGIFAPMEGAFGPWTTTLWCRHCTKEQNMRFLRPVCHFCETVLVQNDETYLRLRLYDTASHSLRTLVACTARCVKSRDLRRALVASSGLVTTDAVTAAIYHPENMNVVGVHA